MAGKSTDVLGDPDLLEQLVEAAVRSDLTTTDGAGMVVVVLPDTNRPRSSSSTPPVGDRGRPPCKEPTS
jgi:hypothetical protein